MQQKATGWLEEYGDYISGALTGLLGLQLAMLFYHLITTYSMEGYSLAALPFIIVALALFHIERMYRKQEMEAH